MKRLILEFKKGFLDIANGTNLQSYLSKQLHCQKMRISRKLILMSITGKTVFHRQMEDIKKLTPEQKQQRETEIRE